MIRLSAREYQIAFLMMYGYTRPDIAEYYYISPRTVDFHLSNLRNKILPLHSIAVEDDEGTYTHVRGKDRNVVMTVRALVRIFGRPLLP